MTDQDLVAKKLAFLETCVRDLQRQARPPSDIVRDEIYRGYVERKLQVAIQAALDVASHVVSDERLGEPRTNRELFDLLAARAFVPMDLAAHLADMVGFRNILVHGYQTVDPARVQAIVEHRLGDLVAFAVAIRLRLRTP